VKPGDHVVLSFIPNCGVLPLLLCGPPAASPICDMGATILEGYLPGEALPPSPGPAAQYGAMCMIGTFQPVRP